MKKLVKKLNSGFISLAILLNSAIMPVAGLQVKTEVINDAAVAETFLTAKTPFEEGIRRADIALTAYSSTPDQTDDTPFITAAGTRVRDGIVAANFLPLYTRIKIPELFGEKVFVVEDRMARRYQDRVDIWFPDRSSARKFGIKTAEIVVLN